MKQAIEKEKKNYLLLLLLLFSITLNSQTTYYVSTSGNDSNNGQSWGNAFRYLQTAIATASSGDEIWVAAGTYYPDEGTNQTNDNRSATFVLKSGVEIYGGFNGTETLRSQRNWGTNITILSGDLDQNDNDSPTANNAYHVVSSSATTGVLDGFTITLGLADTNVFPNRFGAGIYISNANVSPNFTNLKITGNSSTTGGSGVYISQSASPIFTNVVFSGNIATVFHGGAIFNDHSATPTFNNITVSGNTAQINGGGIYSQNNANPTINNSIIWNNKDSSGTNTGASNISNATGGATTNNNMLIAGYGVGSAGIISDSDPLFVNPISPNDAPSINGDFRLQRNSPAVDVGNNSYNSESLDLVGFRRIVNGTINLGAYEKLPSVTFYVNKASGNDSNNGESWASAFENLETALENAIDSDVVWVAQGTYTPSKRTVTNDPESATFTLKNIEIYGGFLGNETLLSQRDWKTNETILSGNLDSNNKAYHVVSSGNTDSSAILDGFLITEGSATSVSQPNGGGIYNVNASPTFKNLLIFNNFCDFNGAGIYNQGSSSKFINIDVRGNTPSLANTSQIYTYSGGVYNTNSPVTFTNLVVSGNRGIGVINNGSHALLINATITGNESSGIENRNSNPTIQNSIIWNNLLNGVPSDINSVLNLNSSPSYANCLIQYFDIGNGVISNSDPLLRVDFTISTSLPSTAGFFALKSGSPAIDVGNNSYNTETGDIFGEDRIQDGIINLGAHETVISTPTVSTTAATNIQTTKVTVGGNATFEGGLNQSISERGIIYIPSNSGSPKIGSGTEVVLGDGLGTFSTEITGLIPNTRYSYVAYAINNLGVSYGTISTFTTPIYSEIFSIDNKGVLSGNCDSTLASCTNSDFTGVDWTMDGNFTNIDSQGFFTQNGVLQTSNATGSAGYDVCWVSPTINISSVGIAAIQMDLSWTNFDNADYIDVQFSIDGNTFLSIPNQVSDGDQTIRYANESGTANISDNLTLDFKGIIGSTLQIKVCIRSSNNSEIVTIDNIKVISSSAGSPIVNTNSATNITNTSATLSGNIISTGGSTITNYGFVLSQTLENSVPLIGGTSVSRFSERAVDPNYMPTPNNLRPNTQYSYRSYAINNIGTTYGPIKTFTTSVNYPGNVGNEISLWIKADYGPLNSAIGTYLNLVPTIESITTPAWVDVSGNGINEFTNSDLTSPVYKNNTTDNINFNPVVDFSGDVGMRFSEVIYSSGSGNEDGMTWFVVVKPDDTASSKTNQFVFDFGSVAGDGYGLVYGEPNFFGYTPSNFGGVRTSGTPPNPTNIALARFTLDFNNIQTFHINGETNPTSSNAITLSQLTAAEIIEQDLFTIGRQAKVASYGTDPNTRRDFDGKIAEIIGYKRVLNATEINKIESYLALKYGVTKDNTDGGSAGDYVDVNNTLLWDASVNPNYHNNVIGIGRNDQQQLNQKQSKITDNSFTIYKESLAETNLENTNSFSSDASFVLLGDNSAQLIEKNTELPNAIVSRLEREWKVTKTNYSDTFSVEIILDASVNPLNINLNRIQLLVDNDGDFSNGGTTSFGNGDNGLTFSQDNLKVIISNISNNHISNNSTSYFTLGNITNTTPSVTSAGFSNIKHTTVKLIGNVSNNGGSTVTENGFVYALSNENNNPVIGGANVTKVTVSNGIGSIEEDVKNLENSKQYSFKFYATNAFGTIYSDVQTFTTLSPNITYSGSGFNENNTNDGSVYGSINIVLEGDQFKHVLTTTDITLGNIPNGLIPSFTVQTPVATSQTVSERYWDSITYGNGLFVAVSSDDSNQIMTSPDGENWTVRNVNNHVGLTSITYGKGLFVAVSSYGTNRILTSPDGVNWTPRTAPENNAWFSVTYGNGLFVAVSTSGTNRVMTSQDGVNWTARTASEQNSWNSVTFGNGLFVAVSYNGTNRAMTSIDGINWTSRVTPEQNLWQSITYGNNLFVAVSSDGTNRVMTSQDGVNWTARTASEQNTWSSVSYGDGLFVAVSTNGTNRLMSSSDTINWNTIQTPEQNSWRSITYGNGDFVAISSNGNNRVMVLEAKAKATLSLNGTTTSNNNDNDVSNITFNFNTSAFISSSANDVTNAINSNSNLGIDFEDRFTNHFTASNGNWSISANWSLNRIPIVSDNIIVDNGSESAVDISDNIVYNFTNLGTTILPKTSSITVTNDFSNSGTFTINSDENDSGVLLIEGNSTGNVIYKRGGLLTNKWSLLSPPVSGQKIVEFAQNPNNDIRVNTTVTPNRYAIGVYNDANSISSKWVYYNANTNTNVTFEVGESYAISRATDGEVTFTGSLATNTVNKDIVGNQWNAIGNPFATYLPLNRNSNSNFLGDNLTNLEIPSIYIWDNVQDKYIAITDLVSATERSITPGQGFFIKAKTSATQLQFDRNKRRKKPTTGTHTFNKSENNTPFVKVFLEKDNIKINTDVIFSETATLGFDEHEDIENFGTNAFDINTHLVENSNGKNFTIQSVPKSALHNSVIPLSVNAKKNDKITFYAEKFNFSNEINLYLEDKKYNSFIELNLNEDKYEIVIDETISGVGRYYLHTNNKSLSIVENDPRTIAIFLTKERMLRVKGLEKQADLVLYSLLGKRIHKYSLTNDSSVIQLPKDISSGIYIVRLDLENKTITKKIFIK